MAFSFISNPLRVQKKVIVAILSLSWRFSVRNLTVPLAFARIAHNHPQALKISPSLPRIFSRHISVPSKADIITSLG